MSTTRVMWRGALTRARYAWGRRSIALFIGLLSLVACQPEAKQQAHEEPQLHATLPDEIIAYGGSDDLQAWLFRVQSYAQGAHPNTPPFAMMMPTLIASGLGLTLPQVIDLSSPARWLIASPQILPAEAQTTAPVQHSPYLTIPAREVSAPWRGVVALKLRSNIDARGLKDALNSGVWHFTEQGAPGEELYAKMSAPDKGLDEGHLIAQGGWLYVGNDLSLIRRSIPALISTLKRPLSQGLSLNVRLEPLEQYLKRAHPERMTELAQKHQGLWSSKRSSLATLELEVSDEAMSVSVSSTHTQTSPLSAYTIDGGPALERLPKSVGGILITSSALPTWSALIDEYREELPPVLTLLSPPPKLGLTFALNERLELSGLVTGGGAERGPWMSALLKALEAGINAQQAKREAVNQVSSGPKSARDAALVLDKPIAGQRVEALKLFGLPKPDIDAPVPSLSQLNVQLSETRLLHASDASYLTFGPKSRAYLELWSQLAQAGQLGVVERPDLARFKGGLKDLLLWVYLAPPSVDRALGKTPVGRPQDPNGREGISLIAQATKNKTSLACTIPVGVAERVVSSILSGKLNISQGKRP